MRQVPGYDARMTLTRTTLFAIGIMALSAAPTMATTILPGPYEADIISVSGEGKVTAAVKLWFGHVAVVSVTPRTVERKPLKPQCGLYAAVASPALAPGKKAFLSKIRRAGREGHYSADVSVTGRGKETAAADKDIPVVLRGGRASACRPR